MSFFRSLRSSITRAGSNKSSSSRDSTPVRATTSSSSRPSSILVEEATAQNDAWHNSQRNDNATSTLNRGETFILNNPAEDTQDQQSNSNSNKSNSSTLEKKSKKSKVLSKFSTFTKRKKTPPVAHLDAVDDDAVDDVKVENAFAYHPNDNATNTYYKWQAADGDAAEGSNNLVNYDAHTDPFNFLYEQHSNLKFMQNDGKQKKERVGVGHSNANFDSSTFRKCSGAGGRAATTQLKSQLKLLNTQNSIEEHQTNDVDDVDEHAGEHDLNDEQKYKTVTLNSFRKSFRDKYLQQQNEAPHQPAWFVQVDSEEKARDKKSKAANNDYDAKENRPDYLQFENENYRPGSRSPVRSNGNSIDGRKSRSTTRSPVKRNETFRVERSSFEQPTTPTPTTASSIRVEIKNSAMPQHHMTAGRRIVPIGVAKPMPMLHANNATKPSTMTSVNNPTAWRATAAAGNKKYQTLIQISNDGNNLLTQKSPKSTKPTTATSTATSTAFNRRSSSQQRSNSTRIQLVGEGNNDNNGRSSYGDTFNKFNNGIGSRYSYAAPTSNSTLNGFNSTDILRTPTTQQKLLHQQPYQQQPRFKQTYFGGNMFKTTPKITTTTTTTTTTRATATQPTPSGLVMSSSSSSSATPIRTLYGGGGQNYGHTNNNATTFINNFNTKIRRNSPKRNSSTAAINTPAASTTTVNINSNNCTNTFNARDLYQPRFTPVPSMQRRSRSPIKMPWR